MDVAEAGVSVAQLQLLNTVRSVVLEVQTAFVELLQAKADLALALENRTTFLQTVEINASRVRNGDLAEVELIRTQVAELQFENAVAQAQLRVDAGRTKLQALLGRKRADKLPDATGEFRREDIAAGFDALRDRALNLRPDYLALQQDVARSQAELRLQLAQGKADYVAGTEYRRQQGLAGTGSMLGIFLSTNLQIFNRNQGEIERARQEQAQAQARIRALEAAIESDVQIAWLQYSTARETLRRIEGSMLSKATDVRAITERAYRRGSATFSSFWTRNAPTTTPFNCATQRSATLPGASTPSTPRPGFARPERGVRKTAVFLLCLVAIPACRKSTLNHVETQPSLGSASRAGNMVTFPAGHPQLSHIRVAIAESAQVPQSEVVAPGRVELDPGASVARGASGAGADYSRAGWSGGCCDRGPADVSARKR